MSALHSCVTRKTDIQIWVGFITKLERISTFMSDEEPTETESRIGTFRKVPIEFVPVSESPIHPDIKSVAGRSGNAAFARLDMSEVFEQ